MSTYWRTVDFRPVATHGWRVLLLKPEQGVDEVPLVGWLVQEEWETHPYDGEHSTGERRIVGAIMTDDCEPETLHGIHGFWAILGPFEPTPSAEDEARFRAEREAVGRAVAEREKAS
ncbi:hypothetical protein SAMN05443665_104572 [Actinomadura meyerae]|uniref:Uncharacterized protein n=1 Tax=Actinomadura meyerae TaxID=240840 RepID=A0A239NPI5_9ACTN|nr:hypothetical protein [Actinomadura meyerae]SNT56690.1 hypothetical protein SAMN05443665_104572 [Actinomadura meyerae]